VAASFGFTTRNVQYNYHKAFPYDPQSSDIGVVAALSRLRDGLSATRLHGRLQRLPHGTRRGTFHGNGYTGAQRLVEMAVLRCADVTLLHGYRYFVLMGAADLSGTTSFTTLGYAHTTGYANVFGNFATGSATTIVTPPQTYRFYKPGVQLVIRMSNNEKQLEGIGIVVNGQRARPKDAAFLDQSLRAHLGIREGS
jgi:hypothetical protein